MTHFCDSFQSRTKHIGQWKFQPCTGFRSCTCKAHYKQRFISSSCHCSPTKQLCILLTSTLGTIESLLKKCSNWAFENSGINYFWSVKIGSRYLINCMLIIGAFDFSTLYTTLPHSLIQKNSHTSLNGHLKKSECEYIYSNSFRSFFNSNKHKNYVNWTYFDTITALEFLLDIIFVSLTYSSFPFSILLHTI